MFIPERAARRAANNCTPGANDCLISNYSIGSHGYAQIGWHQTDGKRVATTAHRAAWVARTGEQIPDGLTVDHICHVRKCVNPAHLRLLSNLENARDNGQARTNPTTGQIWSCGHEAVRRPSGSLYCRECNNRKRAELRRKQKAAA